MAGVKIIDSALSITGNSTVGGDAKIQGDLTVAGNQTITGTQTITGDVSFAGSQTIGDAATDVHTINGGINQAPVTLTPAESVSITKAANSGRMNLIPSTATAHDEYVLPVAAAAGETYEFSWSGIAVDADMVLFVAPSADALTFTGGILDFKTDETGAGLAVIVFPGAANDKLTIDNVQNLHLKFTATTTTNYHVTGWVMSTDTQSAFGDLA